METSAFIFVLKAVYVRYYIISKAKRSVFVIMSACNSFFIASNIVTFSCLCPNLLSRKDNPLFEKCGISGQFNLISPGNVHFT